MGIYRGSPEVQHVWLVDPLNKTLEVVGRQEGGVWGTVSFFAENDKVRAEPFPEAEFDLPGLWLD